VPLQLCKRRHAPVREVQNQRVRVSIGVPVLAPGCWCWCGGRRRRDTELGTARRSGQVRQERSDDRGCCVRECLQCAGRRLGGLTVSLLK
jgi:hypothetical protein